MKKYKLLKDLPLAKAGAVFEKINYDMVQAGGRYDISLEFFGDKFNEWFEKIEYEPWKPKFGYTYWYIDETGDAYIDTCEDTSFDKARIEIGNAFETAQDADKAVEKLKALKRLRDHGFKFAGRQWDARRNRIIIEATIPDTEDLDSVEAQVSDDLHLLFKEESD